MMEPEIDIQTLRIGVVGAGSWGTALANLLAHKGFGVDLWAYEPEVRDQIRYRRENTLFLPGIELPPNLTVSNDLEPVVSGKDLLLVVVPSHVMRDTAARFASLVDDRMVVVTASKGIENRTHLTMTGVLAAVVPGLDPMRLTVLSGPSFAREVARQVPTAVTAASRRHETAAFVQHVFVAPYFRVYTSADVAGVELGGAVKNVIAIAAGLVDGLGLGLNTRAALITRGLVEIRRLGMAMGANPHTFAGLAGVGDLILTCTGTLSRNHTLGKQVGEGRRLQEILSSMQMVAEGVKTARSVFNLSRRLGVEMPICREIYRILYEQASPHEALRRLMTRDLKDEMEDLGFVPVHGGEMTHEC